MKKLLLVAFITMIGLSSFAAGEIQKSTPTITKENTVYVKKEAFKIPEGAKATKKTVNDCDVYIVEFSDGDVWIIIIC